MSHQKHSFTAMILATILVAQTARAEILLTTDAAAVGNLIDSGASIPLELKVEVRASSLVGITFSLNYLPSVGSAPPAFFLSGDGLSLGLRFHPGGDAPRGLYVEPSISGYLIRQTTGSTTPPAAPSNSYTGAVGLAPTLLGGYTFTLGQLAISPGIGLSMEGLFGGDGAVRVFPTGKLNVGFVF